MYGRIVVGVAKTDSAQRAVDVAIDLAERYEAELHLVMAFDRSGGRPGQRARASDAEGAPRLASRPRTTVTVQIHVHPGRPRRRPS